MYRNLALWPTFNPWIENDKTKPNPGNGITDGNPLYWLSKQVRSSIVNRITLNADVKWDILPDLYVKGTASGYYFEQTNQSFNKATQTFTQIFTNPPAPGDVSRRATSFNNRTFQQQYNIIAEYTKSFGGHNFGLMLGGEYFDNQIQLMQVSGTQAPTDDVPTVNASTVFKPGDNYSTTTDYRIVSQFGRLNYDFNGRYLATFTFRNDGVSSLPVGNQYGFFPGMSFGWNVHRESFWQNSSLFNVVSTLKPRVSYGVNGNVAGLDRYEVQGLFGIQGTYNGGSGILNTDIINNTLRWEKSRTTDLGLDIGLFHNKITAVFDYYSRNTSDLLTNLPLPSYTGFDDVRTNLGTFQNRGFEASISATVINKPNGLRLDLSANASYNKNKIIKLPPNGQLNNRQGGMQIYDPKTKSLVWVGGFQEGQAIGDVYAFKQLGIFTDDAAVQKDANTRYDDVAKIGGPGLPLGGNVLAHITPGDVNWLDVDKNDTIDIRDQVYMGNINPKWTGGFAATLSYKKFSFYARFQFATGHIIYNDYVARVLGNYQGTFNYIDLQKQSWTPQNPNTDIPKVYYADQVSAPLGKKNYTRLNNANGNLNSNNSHFYEKGNYLAGREFTLSYDFSSALLKYTKFLQTARAYMSVNNLFYITNFSGPSPEPPVNSDGALTGIYVGTYPTPRSVVFGVEISF